MAWNLKTTRKESQRVLPVISSFVSCHSSHSTAIHLIQPPFISFNCHSSHSTAIHLGCLLSLYNLVHQPSFVYIFSLSITSFISLYFLLCYSSAALQLFICFNSSRHSSSRHSSQVAVIHIISFTFIHHSVNTVIHASSFTPPSIHLSTCWIRLPIVTFEEIEFREWRWWWNRKWLTSIVI